MTFELSLIYQVLAKLERVRNGRRLYSLDVFSLREHSLNNGGRRMAYSGTIFFIGPAIFSNGAFHWVVTPKTTDLKKKHVAFDLSTEKLRVHAFPVNSFIKSRGLFG
jgi:hypothetical protein